MDAHDQDLYNSNMDLTKTWDAIHTYNLFGEVSDFPDVIHCETIATRSALHDWELRPHRHAQLHQVLIVQSGGGTARLEGELHALTAMRFANVPAGHVHGFSFFPGTVGWVVTLAAETLDQMTPEAEGVRSALAQPRVGPCSPRMAETVARIAEEHAGLDFGRAQALRSYCGLLTALVARAMDVDRDARAAPDQRLFQRFRALLEANFLDHLGVADYASRLGVTPTHLSRVTRQASGLSASKIIQERILHEARRNLIYTNLSAAQIAYALGFGDPAYFNRVFAKATGHPPAEFRKWRQMRA